MPIATHRSSRKRPSAVEPPVATRTAKKRPAAHASHLGPGKRDLLSKRPAATEEAPAPPEESMQEGFVPLLVSADGSRYTGELHNGKFHSHGELTLPSGYVCSGTFECGQPSGRCTLYDPFKETLLSGWYTDGKLNSPATKVNARTGRLVFRGRYEHDKPVGMAEVFDEYNGRVIGFVDGNGSLSGDDIVYIFPDGRTALAGTFVDGEFQSGRYGRLRVPLELPPPPPPQPPQVAQLLTAPEAYTEGKTWHPKPLWSQMLLPCEVPMPDEMQNACPYADDFMANSDSTMAILKGVFGEAAMSCAHDGQTRTMVQRLGFEAASECDEVVTSGCLQPLVRDLYEADRVEAKLSTLDDGTDGLFAVTDINAGEFCAWNLIEIPPTEEFRATCGQKAKRGTFQNVEQISFKHPRFGIIKALRAVKAIQQGQEVLLPL